MFLALVCFSLFLFLIFFQTCFISFLGQRLNPAGSCSPTALFMFLAQDPRRKEGRAASTPTLVFDRSLHVCNTEAEFSVQLGEIHITWNSSFKVSHSGAFGTCTMGCPRGLCEGPQHFVTPKETSCPCWGCSVCWEGVAISPM